LASLSAKDQPLNFDPMIPPSSWGPTNITTPFYLSIAIFPKNLTRKRFRKAGKRRRIDEESRLAGERISFGCDSVYHVADQHITNLMEGGYGLFVQLISASELRPRKKVQKSLAR
jgi:hypothetical protein